MPDLVEAVGLLVETGVVVGEATYEADVLLKAGAYAVRLAVTEQDRLDAFRLRFKVFNLELNEGLESAYADGYDVDRYDAICDHLLVEHTETGAVIGTYRLQRGEVADQHYGFYSEQEFDLTPFAGMRAEIVELGRACIEINHRSSEVLHLLWRGIARYVIAKGCRYMMGCCSLSSLDSNLGHNTYKCLEGYLTEPGLRATPRETHRLDAMNGAMEETRPPKLLRAYLTIGAKICGEPAIDREFKTIDFLTLLDLHNLHPRVAARFL